MEVMMEQKGEDVSFFPQVLDSWIKLFRGTKSQQPFRGFYNQYNIHKLN